MNKYMKFVLTKILYPAHNCGKEHYGGSIMIIICNMILKDIKHQYI